MTSEATPDELGWAVVQLANSITPFTSDEYNAKVTRVCDAINGIVRDGDRVERLEQALREIRRDD